MMISTLHFKSLVSYGVTILVHWQLCDALRGRSMISSVDSRDEAFSGRFTYTLGPNTISGISVW